MHTPLQLITGLQLFAYIYKQSVENSLYDSHIWINMVSEQNYMYPCSACMVNMEFTSS